MYKGNKKISIILLLGVTAVLTGCGENRDELNNKLTYNVNLSFINSLPYMADFYVQKRSISTGYNGLFDSDRLVAGDVPVNGVGSTYDYNYKFINNMLNVGVKDSINTGKEQRMTTTLHNGDNLWVIAWQTSGTSKLSVINKQQHNKADTFNVRVFANGRYDVSAAGSKVFTTEQGKVSEYLSVSHCADSLKVADNTIDLCSGNFGASYLLVVDHNGKLVMAAE